MQSLYLEAHCSFMWLHKLSHMTLQKRLFVAFVFFEVTVMLSSDLYSRPFMSSIRKLFRNYKINA